MDTLAEAPHSALSGVARVLVHAGKLNVKTAEELVKASREKRTIFVSSVISAGAVSPLDGIWSGTSKASGADVGKGTGAAACMDTELEVNVLDDMLRGSVLLDGTYFLVQGKVAKDGSVSGFVGDDELKGRFEGASFAGVVTAAGRDCKHAITLKRR